MRTRTLAAAMVLMATAAMAATHLIVPLDTALNMNPATNRTVLVTKLQPVRGNPATYYTTTNSWFAISNIAAGDWELEVKQRGSADGTRINFFIGGTNLGVIGVETNMGVLGAQTYPTTGKMAWSIAASDARYLTGGNSGSATNVTLRAGAKVVVTTNTVGDWTVSAPLAVTNTQSGVTLAGGTFGGVWNGPGYNMLDTSIGALIFNTATNYGGGFGVINDGSVYGTTFYGDGSHLTGISGSGTTYTNNSGYAGLVVGSGIGTNTSSAQVSAIMTTNANQIAAFYVTNNVEDRSSIYVTGNASSLVNGQYKIKWYNPDAFLGIWTNTASTNMILMNNPSNTFDMSSQPFVVAGASDATAFMNQRNQIMLGVRDSWINPFDGDGSVFVGTASLNWATNTIRRLVVTPYITGYTNTLIATNMIQVDAGTGDDTKSTRLNGIPFQSLFVAQSNAQSGDLIFLRNGYYVTDPFHMTNRNFHILGESVDNCIVEIINHDDEARHFQSCVIVPWDNCSVGNFTITNGAIALAQFNGISGGTNVWVHDLVIYPPIQIKYPDNTNLDPSDGDQQQYYNVGVKVSRIGSNNRIERVKVYGGMLGFDFQTSFATSGTNYLVDCEAYMAPQYAGNNPNVWTNNDFMSRGLTNRGGMIPIGFNAAQVSDSPYPFTVNIQGGTFSSMNGGTNLASMVGGETQPSRNASLWISRAYTNTVTINISRVPRFSNGNTNTLSYAVLNETTNNKVVMTGWYFSNRVDQVTNLDLTVPRLLTTSNLTVSGTATIQNIDQPTNTWAINTAVGLGTNSYYTGGAQTLGFTGVAQSPDSTIRWGEFEGKPTGDWTLTNPVSFKTSDYAITRTITNGNSVLISVRVKPGISTNLVIVQTR